MLSVFRSLFALVLLTFLALTGISGRGLANAHPFDTGWRPCNAYLAHDLSYGVRCSPCSPSAVQVTKTETAMYRYSGTLTNFSDHPVHVFATATVIYNESAHAGGTFADGDCFDALQAGGGGLSVYAQPGESVPFEQVTTYVPSVQHYTSGLQCFDGRGFYFTPQIGGIEYGWAFTDGTPTPAGHPGYYYSMTANLEARSLGALDDT